MNQTVTLPSQRSPSVRLPARTAPAVVISALHILTQPVAQVATLATVWNIDSIGTMEVFQIGLPLIAHPIPGVVTEHTLSKPKPGARPIPALFPTGQVYCLLPLAHQRKPSALPVPRVVIAAAIPIRRTPILPAVVVAT